MGEYQSQVIPTLAVVLVLGYILGRRTKVLVGKDNRFSTSKVVTYVWTVFVVCVFASLTVINIATDADLKFESVTNQYLLLLGGPFLALVAAKGIVTSRLSNGTLQKSDAENFRLTDVVTNDKGNADLVDLQFTLFNLVALFWAAANFIEDPAKGLPAIPEGLAALTSVAALTYIGNKAVEHNTPRITSLSPASASVNQTVTIRGTRLVSLARSGETVTPPIITVDGFNVEPVTPPAVSETEIAFAVPSGVEPGIVDVTVSSGFGPDGSGSATVKLRIVEDQ